MSAGSILLVEDEIGIAEFVKQGLVEEDFLVVHCTSGEEALDIIKNQLFDVILLDRMLIEADGLEVCKVIRTTYNLNTNTPIIFVTANDTVQNTIEGLKAGANDYIKKPFSFDELVARIQVYLRNKVKDSTIVRGNIKIDTSTYQVFVNDVVVEFTAKEFQLLLYLFENQNKVCTRKEIIERIWDIHFDYDTSVIDVFINSIRKKLGLKKDDPRLQTIRGIGYISKDV